MNNKDRILKASIDIFNQSGVAKVSTNHIAEALNISPGNLYFHFRNKEEILRVLYTEMTKEIYALWRPHKGKSLEPPIPFIEKSFEIFWKYRFFHREMYHLRRRDPAISKKWKFHITRCFTLLKNNYNYWVNSGIAREIKDFEEMQMVSTFVLVTSSSFLQFFEGKGRIPSRASIDTGIRFVLRFLLPYFTEKYQKEIHAYMTAAGSTQSVVKVQAQD